MSERQISIMEAAIRVIARNGVRGLRVEKLAKEAGISTALIYYHFGDRAGLLRRTLDFVADRAENYSRDALDLAEDPRHELELLLSLELQDLPTVRENSTAWGELRASAVFDPDLRDFLRRSTQGWNTEIADAVRRAQRADLADAKADPHDVAEHLTTLVEGLSERWLSGSMTVDRARELLRGAIVAQLGERRSRG